MLDHLLARPALFTSRRLGTPPLFSRHVAVVERTLLWYTGTGVGVDKVPVGVCWGIRSDLGFRPDAERSTSCGGVDACAA
jgi:hypothetical protein